MLADNGGALKKGNPLLDLHSFVDPNLTMQWQEIGQTSIDLFRVIVQNYPASFDQTALVKLQLFCLYTLFRSRQLLQTAAEKAVIKTGERSLCRCGVALF